MTKKTTPPQTTDELLQLDVNPETTQAKSVVASEMPGVLDGKESTTNVDEINFPIPTKTLSNTSVEDMKGKVNDVVVWGDGDMFKLLCKASSKAEGWMKSTKAMEIKNVGCVVQVTTQQGSNISDALVFVPGARIDEEHGADGKVVSRKLIR